MSVRAATWAEDEKRIARIDTSYSTDRVYRITSDDNGFALTEHPADAPVRRRHDVSELAQGDVLFVSEVDGEILGAAGAELSSWNRRAMVTGLYVSAPARGRGVGTALVEALAGWARAADVHCLWLETQNVNYPAVQFYRRIGFRLCGLDDRLYDPEQNPGDVALFFALDL